MTYAPGKKALGIEGRWERDLEADLRRLRELYRTDILVSLLQANESEKFEIPDLLERARAQGMETFTLPIPDGGTPSKSRANAPMASGMPS